MTDLVSAYRRHAKRGDSVSIRYLCRGCMRGGPRNAMVAHLQHKHNATSTTAHRLCSEALADLKNVSVEGFSGLLMDFVQQHDARVVLRGVRAVSDFDYEFQLAGMNRKLYPEVETVFMTPGEEYMFLSATLVREISVMGGDVSQFVSPVIAQRLKQKIQGLGGR